MKKILPFAAVLLLCAGCIPFGDPPSGPITENTEKIPLTPAEKRERMISDLTVMLMQHAPGSGMQFRADTASIAEMRIVVRECAKITGIYHDNASAWQLYSCFTDKEWTIELSKDGQIVDRVRVSR